jgi:surface antigen
MRFLGLGVAAVLAVSTAACDGSHQTTGAIAGAAIGAAAGSMIGHGSGRIAATAIGAVLGAAIGSEIGRQLDERDRQMYAEAAARAAESEPVGQPMGWQNPQSGNRGTVTPTSRRYQGADGRVCRNFSDTITLKDGSTQTVNGRRCKNADGSWEFQSA